MQPYLTIERFRVSGYLGADDLDSLSDAEIRSILGAASTKVDTWCNAPQLPQPYSFRGGSITDEQHPWDPGDGVITYPSRRIFLRHGPVKTVTECGIYVTNQQRVLFVPDEIFIIGDLKCIEIVSLAMTASGLFGAFMVPNIGLGRPVSRTSYTYGYEFVAVDEQIEATDGLLYRAINQFWDDSAVTIKVDGDEVSSGIKLDRVEGTVTFDSPPEADAVVTASYGYTLPHAIAVGTAIIAHEIITERQLHDKGLGNVRSLKVGEISIDRGMPRAARIPTIEIPAEAEAYLTPYRFITIR